MALIVGAPVIKFINGAASATLATAVSNANTAMSTLLANANNAIYVPNTIVNVISSAIVVASDAAVANDQYMGYFCVAYQNATLS